MIETHQTKSFKFLVAICVARRCFIKKLENPMIMSVPVVFIGVVALKNLLAQMVKQLKNLVAAKDDRVISVDTLGNGLT